MLKLFWITVISGLLLAACRQRPETTRPVLEKITESVYASGWVKSRNQYEVFANASGLVTALLVKEGDIVKKGDPLLQLSDKTAQLNTEHARLAAAYSTRQANAARLEELQVNIEQAVLKLRNDSLLWERQRNLWAQQIGTRNELEQRELAFQSALHNYASARLRYDEMLRQVRLQEQQSGTSLQIARSLTGDLTVRSEVAGRVYQLLKEKGEMVNPQAPVAVVGEAGAFLLELQVDEFDIARLKPGLKVLLTMDSYEGQVFEALLSKIYPFMNQRTKTFTVEAVFVQPPAVLYPFLTCEANIIVQEKEKGLTLPAAFLMEGGYVMLRGGEKRKVQTGLRDYRKVEILDGLTVQDVVVKPGL